MKELSIDFETGKKSQNINYKTPDCHGTRCAGQIVSSGQRCGVGISFDSRICSIRILVKETTVISEIEVAAITRNNQKIHIYNCSWGPPDDGKIVDAPNKDVLGAFIDSSLWGRDGKGNLFVFASGNGGPEDDCNLDGYANSLLSLTVGSIGDLDTWPTYMEPCSAQWATLYGSTDRDSMIYTSDLKGKCTFSHGGTSAAAPLMSGIIALALSARPDLTWRDVRYLLVRTCLKPSNNDDSWVTNSVGIEYSRKYGFGKVDAKAFVDEAKKWKVVGSSTIRRFKTFVPTNDDDGYFGNGDDLAKRVYFDIGPVEELSYKLNDIIYLEQVLLRVSIRHSRRGLVNISLTSPSGTTHTLLSSRPLDKDNSISSNGEGLNNWTLMSLGFWGEKIRGKWSVKVESDSADDHNLIGSISNLTISFYGLIKPSLQESKESLKELILDSYFGNAMESVKAERYSLFKTSKRIGTLLVFVVIVFCFIFYFWWTNFF